MTSYISRYIYYIRVIKMVYVLSNKELIIINNDPEIFFRHLIFIDNKNIILPIFMYIINHRFILDLNTIVSENGNNFLHILCNTKNISDDILLDFITYILENNCVDVNSVNKFGETFLHKLSYHNIFITLNIFDYVVKNDLIDISIKDNSGHNFLWSLYNNFSFKNEFIYVVNCIKDNELESVYFYCDSSKCLIHKVFDEITHYRLCDEDKKLYDYLLEEYNKTSSLTKSSKKNSILDTY